MNIIPNYLIVLMLCITCFISCKQDFQADDNTYDIAAKQYQSESYVMSIRTLLPLIEREKDAENYNALGNAFYLKGYNYMKLVFPDSALMAFYDAQDAYQLAGNKLSHANVTGEIGTLFIKNWSYDLAKKYYTNVVELSEEIDNDRLKADSYNNIGYCLRMMEDYLDAYVYYEKALDLELELGDNPAYTADIYLEQGLCFYQLGDYSKASDLFWKALAIGKEENLQLTMGKSYVNLGECKIAQGDIMASEKFLKLALDNFNEDSQRRTFVYVNFGRLYYLKHDYSKSIDYYALALDGNPEHIEMQDAFMAYDSLTSIFKKSGQNDSLLLYTTKMNDIVRYVSSNKSKLAKASSLYGIRVMYAHREYELRRVRDQRRDLINFSIMGLMGLCAGLILFWIWSTYRSRKAIMYLNGCDKMGELKAMLGSDADRLP